MYVIRVFALWLLYSNVVVHWSWAHTQARKLVPHGMSHTHPFLAEATRLLKWFVFLQTPEQSTLLGHWGSSLRRFLTLLTVWLNSLLLMLSLSGSQEVCRESSFFSFNLGTLRRIIVYPDKVQQQVLFLSITWNRSFVASTNCFKGQICSRYFK